MVRVLCATATARLHLFVRVWLYCTAQHQFVPLLIARGVLLV
jgi:hypothetical protein